MEYFRFPSCEKPLSSDVFLIKGKDANYVIDVGSTDEAFEFLKDIPNKVVIITHFHQDHTANLSRIECKRLIGGKTGDKISSRIVLEEGIEVLPLTSCHAKGSLAVNLEKKYLFVGDSIFGCMTPNGYGYNSGMLLSTIRELSLEDCEFIVPSHDGEVLEKQGAIQWLKDIYALRKGNEPYILHEIG